MWRGMVVVAALSALGLSQTRVPNLAGATTDGCVRYAPSRVKLTGRVEQRVFAGPPQYLNINEGDRPETTLVLVLDDPLCVSSDSAKVDDAEDLMGLHELQLTFGAACKCGSGFSAMTIELYGNSRCMRTVPETRVLPGRSTKLGGTLRHSLVGHDHTPVILQVETIDGVDKRCDAQMT